MSSSDKLHLKKLILTSFNKMLTNVIKSIDDNKHNEKIVSDLCELVDKFYKSDNISIDDSDDEKMSPFMKKNIMSSDTDDENMTTSGYKNPNMFLDSDDENMSSLNKSMTSDFKSFESSSTKPAVVNNMNKIFDNSGEYRAFKPNYDFEKYMNNFSRNAFKF